MPGAQSGTTDNTYWSRDIEMVHVVSLNSYAGTAPGSLQYQWLKEDISRVDRSRTPWVVAMMHAPWYNSNSGHQGESLLMQNDMEEMLYGLGADVVLNGHVHAYERTTPVYKWEVNECGPVHLNLGDGGNREGAYVPWNDPQPAWSAFRESSFGVGQLRIVNDTHAHYAWHRHACEKFGPTGESYPSEIVFEDECATDDDNSVNNMTKTDEVWIVRPPASICPNRHYSGDPPDPEPPKKGDSDKGGKKDDSDKAGIGGMGVLLFLLLVIATAAAGYLYWQNRTLKAQLDEYKKDDIRTDAYLTEVTTGDEDEEDQRLRKSMY